MYPLTATKAAIRQHLDMCIPVVYWNVSCTHYIFFPHE